MTADPYEADWSNDQGPVVSQAAPNLDESEAGEHAGTSDSNETANRAGSLMPWLAVLALAVIAAEWGCTSVGVQFSQPWLFFAVDSGRIISLLCIQIGFSIKRLSEETGFIL